MLKKGDRVRIKNFTLELNGELATVANTNGYLVYVWLDCQPDNKKYPLELYTTEVENV